MEDEFIKIPKQLLNEGIFQQIENLQHDTDKQRKAYFTATHNIQMTNFQHLSRTWDLQRQDGEKLTEFACDSKTQTTVKTIGMQK